MKKKIFIGILNVLGLLMVSMQVFSQTTELTGSLEEGGGDRIVCHSTAFGRCKARGAGDNCAQSQSGGNIQCSEYNGNC